MFQGPSDRVIGWFLAFNAVNYSFWPSESKKTWYTEIDGRLYGKDDPAFGIMAAFSRAMTHGFALDSADVLMRLGSEDFHTILQPGPGADPLPLMSARLEALHELGEAYQKLGGPLALFNTGGGSAAQLVQSLVRHLPSWEDSRVYRGQRLRFLKRAQLCVAMIYGRFGGKAPAAFADIGSLTAFADYRLPQILREHGILNYSPELAEKIDTGEILVKGSEEEVEIRCATIVAVEQIREQLQRQWPGVTALQVDYLLWRTAVQQTEGMRPFHRCRTTDY